MSPMTIVGLDTNPIPTVDDSLVDLARGSSKGVVFHGIFGMNPDLGTIEEEIWSVGGERAYLISAEVLEIVSSDVADNPSGTGAHKIRIEGVDNEYKELIEELDLDGLTPVSTAALFLRVNRAYITEVGSGDSNVGTITIDPTSAGSGSRHGLIRPEEGEMLNSHFSVPVGKTGLIREGSVSIAKAMGASTKEASIQLWRRRVGEAWRFRGEINLSTDGTSFANLLPSGSSVRLLERTELKWVAVAASVNTIVEVRYTVLLVDITIA